MLSLPPRSSLRAPPDDPIPDFAISLECDSIAASKTLRWCGFSENAFYVSTPPKKYKVMTFHVNSSYAIERDQGSSTCVRGESTSYGWSQTYTGCVIGSQVWSGTQTYIAARKDADNPAENCGPANLTFTYDADGGGIWTNSSEEACGCGSAPRLFATIPTTVITATSDTLSSTFTTQGNDTGGGSWTTTFILSDEVVKPSPEMVISEAISTLPAYAGFDGPRNISGQGLVCSASRNLSTDELTCALRRFKWRLKFNPAPLNYLKVWLRKTTTPETDSPSTGDTTNATTDDTTTVTWTGSASDSDTGDFAGFIFKETAGTEVTEPATDGEIVISILKWSFLADYTPPDDGSANGFRP
jgi:hypothetical protein